MPRAERPLEAGDSPLLGFAGGLRRLREEAGSPTYRQLAAEAHYSAASLSEAAAGRRLPSLAVTLAYVRACRGDAAEWELRWHRLAAELATRTEPAEPTGAPPYAGLAALQPEDAHRFFGREHLVDALVQRLTGQRFVGVFGTSGAGKSSLLRAGLLTRLSAAGKVVVLFTPGPHPLEECAVQLAKHTGTAAGALGLAEDPANLHLAVRLALVDQPADTEVVLVVDQFEEVFTLCADPAEQAWFIEALITATATKTSRCRVVLGVRADFYAHCARSAALVEALADAQVTVGPMSMDELRRAITLPATRAELVLESGLLATLLAHADGEVAVLPLLSHALLETWRRRRGKVLTLQGFQAAGGIDGALAQTAESIHSGLGSRQRVLMRTLLLRLVALGEGTEDTKRRISQSELDFDDPNLAVVLEKLTSARLIARGRDTVEITHEALIRSWPRLRDWLAEDREALRAHRALTEATEAWEALGKDPGALYRGARLVVAKDLVSSDYTVLSGRERVFLETSAAAAADAVATDRRRTRWLRQLVVLLTVLLVLAAAATVFAVNAQQMVTRQRNDALSEKVSGQAAALHAANPALAAQLSLAAYRVSPTAAARGGLLSLFATPFATSVNGHTTTAVSALTPNGHVLATAGVDGYTKLWLIGDRRRPVLLSSLRTTAVEYGFVAISADNRLLATGGRFPDHSVRVWDITDPGRPTLRLSIDDLPGTVRAVAFSPDGRTLATVGNHRSVWLWDIGGRVAVRGHELVGHTDWVTSVAFSPDGRTLATAGLDGTARLWDVAAGRAAGVLVGHTGTVHAVAFTPDGRTLATGGDDRAIRLWELAAPQRAFAVVAGHDDAVRAVAFSPDGRTLASASSDRGVRLWRYTGKGDPVSGLMTLTGHTAPVVSVQFSHDGRTLATASEDHTARLWDVPGSVLAGHTDSVYGVAVHPSGRVAATAGRDGTARVWLLADPSRGAEIAVLSSHHAVVRWVAFSPDGRTLATAGDDGTARLWDITEPTSIHEIAALTGHTGPVTSVAFSPDGRTAATTSDDGTVHLWSVADPRHPRRVWTIAHRGPVTSADFSPDGRHLATAGRADRLVVTWDLGDPHQAPTRLAERVHPDAVTSVRFSPDRRGMVTTSVDRTVRLWDVTNPADPRAGPILTDHADAVYSAAYTPDGRMLVTTSADHTARLWDVSGTPQELATLTGHPHSVLMAAFNPMNGNVVTASHDFTARIWDTDPEEAARRVCALAEPAISRTEWERYLPGLPYEPPCPN
ncbi:WD40 repeat domain-containing protein [Actinokineospora diospyrosa]|uniref:WD40 repeat n=1 Tax=Actinokineospora diospyrosa TaxID=103728 RepID=A0ABT1I5A0_9PSEU|nr:WD40 repeat domain-containing protein [Actinokineospora diospyrosa]MCP2267785.1 WD40 repeat [Actinokineospora diospyrosa]